MEKKLEELLQNGFQVEGFDKSKELFLSLLEGVVPPMSFEKYNEIMSSDYDDLIKSVLKTGKTYVGGTLSFVLVSDSEWDAEYEFYTQDDKKNVYRSKGKAGPFPLRLLVDESKNKLLMQKKVTFELTEPKK